MAQAIIHTSTKDTSKAKEKYAKETAKGTRSEEDTAQAQDCLVILLQITETRAHQGPAITQSRRNTDSRRDNSTLNSTMELAWLRQDTFYSYIVI